MRLARSFHNVSPVGNICPEMIQVRIRRARSAWLGSPERERAVDEEDVATLSLPVVAHGREPVPRGARVVGVAHPVRLPPDHARRNLHRGRAIRDVGRDDRAARDDLG
jgi:hypothetical protein